MYKVTGGVFTDTTFEQMIDGTKETYGPFETYEEAYNIWKSKMFQNVDNALHRLIIIPVVTSYC